MLIEDSGFYETMKDDQPPLSFELNSIKITMCENAITIHCFSLFYKNFHYYHLYCLLAT